MKRKPTTAAIRGAAPLSLRKGELVTRLVHPVTACNLCGNPSAQLGLWRECDIDDRPIQSPTALVFIGQDHPACLREMEEHPRLYVEVQGMPGHFPLLCGPCRLRDGWSCRHEDLRSNGGKGLKVQIGGFLPGAIICSRNGCGPVSTPRAVECAGRAILSPNDYGVFCATCGRTLP